MKYIRTQDGRIIKIFDGDIDNEICGIKFDTMGFRLQITMQFNCIVKEDIVKIADTIEDLCDEFVLDHPLFGDSCKCLYHSFEKAKNGIKKRSDNAHNLYDFNIYGAIWTELGLKYVAKMNDKGELELL